MRSKHTHHTKQQQVLCVGGARGDDHSGHLKQARSNGQTTPPQLRTKQLMSDRAVLSGMRRRARLHEKIDNRPSACSQKPGSASSSEGLGTPAASGGQTVPRDSEGASANSKAKSKAAESAAESVRRRPPTKAANGQTLRAGGKESDRWSRSRQRRAGARGQRPNGPTSWGSKNRVPCADSRA